MQVQMKEQTAKGLKHKLSLEFRDRAFFDEIWPLIKSRTDCSPQITLLQGLKYNIIIQSWGFGANQNTI